MAAASDRGRDYASRVVSQAAGTCPRPAVLALHQAAVRAAVALLISPIEPYEIAD